jgi:hypothetical protein
MKNNNNLHTISTFLIFADGHEADKMVKQNHCMPTWAIPRSPETHSNVLTILQHCTSALEAGRTRMFAMLDVLEVVPSSIK